MGAWHGRPRPWPWWPQGLPKAPRVHEEMAMEWPLQVKLLSKPTNVLQNKTKQEMWYVIKSSLPFFFNVLQIEISSNFITIVSVIYKTEN